MGIEIYLFAAFMAVLVGALVFGAMYAKRKWVDGAMERLEKKHKELIVFEDGLRDTMEAFELYVMDARKELEQVVSTTQVTPIVQRPPVVPPLVVVPPAPVDAACPPTPSFAEQNDDMVQAICALTQKGLGQKEIGRRLGISTGEAMLARKMEERKKHKVDH